MTRRLALSALSLVLVLGLLPARAGAPKTMKGQVVCSGCWDEAPDRKKTPYGTEEDIKCAVRCEKTGVAAALAVDDGKTYQLYELAPGTFKPEGKGWLKYMGKHVEATGRLEGTEKKPKLVVDALKVVEKK
jgi:hypothetical protein